MPRIVRRIGILVLLILGLLAFASAGCGSDEPEVCKSLKDLKGSVAELEDVDLSEGDVVGQLRGVLDNVEADLLSVKNAAQEELGTEIAGFTAAVEEFVSTVQAIADAETIDTESLTALFASIGSAVSAYQTLEEAVPDCGL